MTTHRDYQVRLYLLVIAYAPRWLRLAIPKSWRHAQLRKILKVEADMVSGGARHVGGAPSGNPSGRQLRVP